MHNSIQQSFCSILNVLSVAILLSQMNKAGVLRKAIEVILKLQNDNARLKQENMALKMAQQKRGIAAMQGLSNLCTVFCLFILF